MFWDYNYYIAITLKIINNTHQNAVLIMDIIVNKKLVINES